MTTTSSNRAERREEIRLKLEYVKVGGSIAVFIALLFAALQWKIANQNAEFANQIANENTYQRMVSEWREHLKTFVEKPKLLPYFFERKVLTNDDPSRNEVIALVSLRLSTMDSILTYAAIRGIGSQTQQWEDTFSMAFRESPETCSRVYNVLQRYSQFYGAKLSTIFKESCSGVTK